MARSEQGKKLGPSVKGRCVLQSLAPVVCVGLRLTHFQLTQFMLLPLLPFHHHLHLNGTHFTKHRFFDLDYVRAVLRRNVAYNVTDDTPMDEIVRFYAAGPHGVDYDAHHAAVVARADEQQLRAVRVDKDDF